MLKVSTSSGGRETTQGCGLDEDVPAVGDPGREAAPNQDGGAYPTAEAGGQARCLHPAKCALPQPRAGAEMARALWWAVARAGAC